VPFIACLNNVKTTHARKHMPFPRRPIHKEQDKPKNTRPTPQSRNEPADSSHTATRKETGPRREDNYTLTTHPSRACSEDARVHYADLKQQPHQTTHPHPVETRAKRGTEAQPHTHPIGVVVTADPSGPNSVLDPTPTNAGHERTSLHPPTTENP
jgi:hypothetical protein